MLLDCANAFSDFEGRIWLNASHQGPLPHVAVEAAQMAIALKHNPVNVSTSEPFTEVPLRLRRAIASLIHAEADDVILGNSASYGLHALALGMNWCEGDEVLLVAGDFPSTIFPFLLLREQGVSVRFIEPVGPVVTADELRAHVTDRTRAFCTTWVHSFTGYAVDVDALGSVCRDHDVLFFVNASQAIGNREIQAADAPVDAIVSVGFKWLCGPYGTGFCWIRPRVREHMHPTQLYWLAHFTAEELKGDGPLEPKSDVGARGFDVFGTANFNNFMPWTASIELMNQVGVPAVAQHNQTLVERLIESLDPERYSVCSPRSGEHRSCIVMISHRDASRNTAIYDHLRENGVDNALRKGRLRFAPHFYNTPEQIDRACELLKEFP